MHFIKVCWFFEENKLEYIIYPICIWWIYRNKIYSYTTLVLTLVCSHNFLPTLKEKMCKIPLLVGGIFMDIKCLQIHFGNDLNLSTMYKFAPIWLASINPSYVKVNNIITRFIYHLPIICFRGVSGQLLDK
jgi:hypothetical protein